MLNRYSYISFYSLITMNCISVQFSLLKKILPLSVHPLLSLISYPSVHIVHSVFSSREFQLQTSQLEGQANNRINKMKIQ